MEITQPLHRAAQLDPDRPHSIMGGRTRTVSESVDRISRLASGLVMAGMRPGDRIGIMSLNSDTFHETLLAVPWGGGVVVPVNYRWSPAEIAFSLIDCDVSILVVDDTFVDTAVGMQEAHPLVTTLIHAGDQPVSGGVLDYEALIEQSEPIQDARRGGTDVFGIFYTGGTTGVAKGVVLTHDNMMTSAFGCVASGEFLTPYGRLMHVAPMFHLADIAAWVGGLILGSTHVFVPSFTPTAALQTVVTHGVTDVLLVPTMIQMMADAPGAGDFDLSSMGHIVYGASPMPEAVLIRARALFPTATFLQAYGMSELAPVATLLLMAEHDDPVLRRSAGRSAPHTEVKVVDPMDVEVPRGTVGEIIARGGATMLGYWKRPEETAQALRGGWMHTGDGGYMDDQGYVFVVDRIKDMIITGGENVYSMEVENIVAKHPSVAACAVIGVPDDQWGEQVRAVVVLQPQTTLTLVELSEFCRRHIAGYKVPRSLSVVKALPISAAGKILKRDLRAQV